MSMSDDDVRVVVVDDVADAAEALAATLTLSGYKVWIATDGAAALALIEAKQPHCVLLDIGMPGMDGNELTRTLRSRYGDDIVLIAVTGREHDDERVSDTFARVDHYLQKPVDADVLRKLLPPVD
jgi:CheY-like chemotaxis protein